MPPTPYRHRAIPRGAALRRVPDTTSTETTTPVQASVHPPVTDPTVRGAVDRLTAEFAGRFTQDLVDHVVRGSRRDLDVVSAAALPEMVERLARQRLIEHL